MGNLLKTPFRTVGMLFAEGLFAVGATPSPSIARPGALNYVEGQVTVDGRSIGPSAIGSTEVAPGQVLGTRTGKAEMLLTPGVVLRLGDNSAVKMISPSLTDTRVQLLDGEALVEAAEVAKENHLAVVDNGVPTELLKQGIYEFSAANPMVQVYDGKAAVQEDDHTVDMGKGKELPLQPGTPLKARKFDRHQEDDLYAWSKLRSEYMAEANAAQAQAIVVDGDPWYGMGWYWNPWFDSYAFMPGGGFLYSPFGYGFYSPSFYYYNPPLYGFYGHGYHGFYPGRGYYGGRGLAGGRIGAGRGFAGRGFAGRGAAAPHFGGGMRGGFGGFHAGGMRGGMAGRR